MSPALLAATLSPIPSPSPSPTGLGGTLTGLGSRITGDTQTITCDRGDVSVCGVIFKWTGSRGVGQVLQVVLGTPLRLVLIILIGILVRRALHRVIDRLANRIASGGNGHHGGNGHEGLFGRHDESPPSASPLMVTRREARSRTLASVLRSITTAVVAIIVVLMVLQELDFSVAPLLASAGVVGVAVGFGAQSLVRDVVSGMFMIVEDQYGVGDTVDLGEAIGTVESVGLRVTQLRDVNGTVWYVRNGEILRVGNKSQGWARVVLDVHVGYLADIDQVESVLLGIASELREEPEYQAMILEEPEVWGVEALSTDGVVVRLVAKTRPLQQPTVARELRRRIRIRFGELGIDMGATPQTVVISEPAAQQHPAEPVDGPVDGGTATSDVTAEQR